MAYRQNTQGNNPYTEDYYGDPQQQQQYRNEFDEGHGGHSKPQYNDSDNDAQYDTYGGHNTYNNQQPYQTYDQGGYNQYTGVAGYQDDTDRNTPSPEGNPPAPPSKEGFLNTTAHKHDDQVTHPRSRGRMVGS
jgi:hypothetical protein